MNAITQKNRALVVDDDRSIRVLLTAILNGRGFTVITAGDGLQAMDRIVEFRPDIILLDIGMAGVDGFEVLRTHCQRSQIPVIMLSARHDVSDKIKCLDLGALDYITKPFATEELVARIKAILRHTGTESPSHASSPPCFDNGRLRVDFDTRRVTVSGLEIRLTLIEYALLRVFVLNPEKEFTKSQLVEEVWGTHYNQESEVLDAHVSRLQSKTTYGTALTNQIISVHGTGYKLVNPVVK